MRGAEIAAALGVSDLEGVRRRLGPTWVHRLRDAITGATEEQWKVLLDGLGSLWSST
jgi:hypothetical protein